jgi:site-specific DNA-methyltransferase (adenine-specific)
MPNIELLNIDCMEYMKTLPDNAFELAIVDPPYGIGAGKPAKKPGYVKQKNGNALPIKRTPYALKDWDSKPADSVLFKELIRVSENQIIWGVNYYKHDFGPGRIVWDKVNNHMDQHDCEIAYCSTNKRVDIVRYMWAGFCQGMIAGSDLKKAGEQIGDKSKNEARIHPTQKPVKLYEWLLKNYAKEGDRILDTHLGSASSAIAAHYGGFDFVGCELDEDYYKAACERFDMSTRQQALF